MNQQPLPNVLPNRAAQNLLRAVEQGQWIPVHMIPELARQMQPMLIPGAEDLQLLHLMLDLVQTTSTYMSYYLSNHAMFECPTFYSTSVYYIYKLALKRRQNPVYLDTLAVVVKRRLRDLFPHAAYLPNLPSLQQIIISNHFYEGGVQGIYGFQKERAWNRFEKVLGEAYSYIGTYHQCHGTTPNVDFLYQFAILYTKYNGGVGREQFHNAACNYLRTNLPQVGQEFFRQLSHGFQNTLTLQDMAVTFA
ncbi:hypothetical protein CAEBREN_19980 [Caenorhabditis brenneri]|uniref:Uncharacterized protein n=1 Tax=Caenorhabditis brenneri TaxID=135651 RepID=G0NZL9_CAEBE|nr:hypothetical protein CAEBREN_19980 [Caenorhabditis brenneri]